MNCEFVIALVVGKSECLSNLVARSVCNFQVKKEGLFLVPSLQIQMHSFVFPFAVLSSRIEKLVE